MDNNLDTIMNNIMDNIVTKNLNSALGKYYVLQKYSWAYGKKSQYLTKLMYLMVTNLPDKENIIKKYLSEHQKK